MRTGGKQIHCGPSAVISQLGATDLQVARFLKNLLLNENVALRRRYFHCRKVSAAQPVDGLEGEWECIDIDACETRILAAA